MGYLNCEKCGGYYELQEGESPDNFEACQCGGSLRYVENKPQNVEENNKSKLICSNCLKESEDGIFCPNCGGKLVPVKNKELFDDISIEESKELERLAKNASKRDKAPKKDKIDNVDLEESKELLQRISWLGVLGGTGFFIISTIFLVVILIFPFIGTYSYGYSSSYSGIAFAFLALIIIGFILAVISGAIASFASKSRDYVDGLINGFLVGLISSIVLGIFGGILTVIIGIIIFGALSTVGGAIGIFVRKKFVDYE